MKPSPSLSLMIIAWCILAMAFAGCLNAEPGSSGPVAKNNGTRYIPSHELKNSPGLPPNDALAACSGRSTGDACQFADRNGVASGQCDEKPGVLSCAPVRSDNVSYLPEERTAHGMTTVQPVATGAGTPPAAMVTSPEETGTFVLSSDAGSDGGTMPDEYSCDGSGSSPALSWSGAPDGTTEFALMMTTLPVDGSTRWNWVLYHIPGTATGIARNGSAIGILGTGSHGTVMMYDPPCSQGPGAKVYTFTLYALSASPVLPASPGEVTGPVLTNAISSITLGRASLDLNHARAGLS
jgi:phosphatidylethanolamine-binding protein (PEBP) family uncharacterized protein